MEKFNLNNYINSHLVEFNTMTGQLKNTLDLVSNELLNLDKVQSQYYIIDRIEDDVIVCEVSDTDKMIEISQNDISQNVKEGDCLIKKGTQFILSEKITDKRKKEILDKFNNLKE